MATIGLRLLEYESLDNGLVRIRCLAADPAPYSQSYFDVVITDQEAALPAAQLIPLIKARYERTFGGFDETLQRGQGITTLNAMKGRAFTITV